MVPLLIDTGFDWLNLLLLLPLAGALLVLLVADNRLKRVLALVVTSGNALATLPVLYGFTRHTAAFQFVHLHIWIPQLHCNYVVGVDGLSLFFLTLTTFLVPLGLLASWHDPVCRANSGLACLLLMESALIGAVIALDFVLFCLFWEALILPMTLLLGFRGSAQSRRASGRWALGAVAGSTPLLLAGVTLYLESGSFFLPAMMWQSCGPKTQTCLLLAFLVSFAVRIPLFPFHTWLKPTLAVASLPATLLLTVLLPALGMYGLLRFCLPLAPDAFLRLSPFLGWFTLLGAVYGCAAALAARTAKTLLAQAVPGCLGLATLGLWTGLTQGMAGALYQTLSVALFCAGLLLLSASPPRAEAGTQQQAASARQGDWAAFCLALLLPAALPLPGTSGFPGLFLILRGTAETQPVLALAAAPGALLTALCLLRLPQLTLLPQAPDESPSPFLGLRQSLTLVPLLLMLFSLGLFSRFFLDMVQPTLAEMLHKLHEWQAGQALLP